MFRVFGHSGFVIDSSFGPSSFGIRLVPSPPPQIALQEPLNLSVHDRVEASYLKLRPRVLHALIRVQKIVANL
jgi:hypothetical protein